MSWKQAFIIGLILTIFVVVLSLITQYTTCNYKTPKYFETIKKYSVMNKLITIEAANDYFNFNSYLLQSFFDPLLNGVLVLAIAAFFLKRS
jgi:hypothetical protein